MLCVEAKHEWKVSFEAIIDGVKDAWEGHVSYKWNFKASKQPACTFLPNNLLKGVSDTCVLWKTNHFKAGLNHDERVRYYWLECAWRGAGKEVNLAIVKQSHRFKNSLGVIKHAKVASCI